MESTHTKRAADWQTPQYEFIDSGTSLPSGGLCRSPGFGSKYARRSAIRCRTFVLASTSRFRWGSPELEAWQDGVLSRQQQESGADSRKGDPMKGTRHQKGYLVQEGQSLAVQLLRLMRNCRTEHSHACRKAHKFVGSRGTIAQSQQRESGGGVSCALERRQNDAAKHRCHSGGLWKATICHLFELHKRISTFHGYRNMWKGYLEPHG